MNRAMIIGVLRCFQETYRAKYNIVKIGIFGSAARDTMNDRSDIDIVVNLERSDFFVLVSIKRILEEQLHAPVDIVQYREKMNKYLKRRIDQEAIYV